jgi:peptidoglycan L-alanyl-D-glutamate endopeptidase CwlK
MTLLNKSNLVKSQLDTKNPQLEDFGRLAYDFVSKYGHDSRIKLASLSKDTSGYFNHDLKLSDKDQISEGMHFKVHDFSEIRYGPSFLPSALFNEASLKEIQGVHPDLLKVVARAREISSVHFEVVPGNGGLRSATEQKRLKHAGKSHANFGRHTVGYAIDLVPISKNGNPNFNDAKGYEGIRSAMETAANELGIPIQWGGNWKRLVDKPHFELDRQAYPVPGDKQLEEYVAQAAFR